MRLWCHALLIEKVILNKASNEFQYRVRAFGTSGSWPVFTHWLKCESLEYEMCDSQDNSVIIFGDSSPDGQPLISGAILTFQDGSKFFLGIFDRKKQFDVADYSDYTDVWAALSDKVRCYWQAPYFPVLQHIPR